MGTDRGWHLREFEPDSVGRISLRDKEKAVRLSRRTALFAKWRARLAVVGTVLANPCAVPGPFYGTAETVYPFCGPTRAAFRLSPAEDLLDKNDTLRMLAPSP